MLMTQLLKILHLARCEKPIFIVFRAIKNDAEKIDVAGKISVMMMRFTTSLWAFFLVIETIEVCGIAHSVTANHSLKYWL